MSRRRDRKGLQVARGERYALIPREVMESEPYRALPPWAVVVLLALCVQYYGRRNGSLALPWAEAHKLGVRTQAQLYSGLQVLEGADLIACCRRGRLVGGRQLATLYALTWRAVDDPATGVEYDSGVSVTVQPTHTWARWIRAADWDGRVREIARRARGKRNHACPFRAGGKIAASPREETAAHPVRSGKRKSRSPREEWETPNPAHPVSVTSEISAPRATAGQEDGR